MVAVLSLRAKLAALTAAALLTTIAVGVVHTVRRARETGARQPPLGVSIRGELQAVGVDLVGMRAPYGALILLGPELEGRSDDVLGATCDTLAARGVDVFLVVGHTVPPKSVRGEHLHVVQDPKGQMRARFGFEKEGSALVLFQKAGALCWGALDGLGPRDLRRQLSAWSARVSSAKSHDAAGTAQGVDSPWAAVLPRFPFDSLLTHAHRVRVDLEGLPRKQLRLEARVGSEELPAPGEPCFTRPTDVAVDEKGRVLVCDTDQETVFVLDGVGRLIRTLGKLGQGPG